MAATQIFNFQISKPTALFRKPKDGIALNCEACGDLHPSSLLSSRCHKSVESLPVISRAFNVSHEYIDRSE